MNQGDLCPKCRNYYMDSLDRCPVCDPKPTAATERATAITALFRRLREQGFQLTKDDHMNITLTADQRAHVEKLIAANTDTGAEPLTVEQYVQGIVDDVLAKHEQSQTGQS